MQVLTKCMHQCNNQTIPFCPVARIDYLNQQFRFSPTIGHLRGMNKTLVDQKNFYRRSLPQLGPSDWQPNQEPKIACTSNPPMIQNHRNGRPPSHRKMRSRTGKGTSTGNPNKVPPGEKRSSHCPRSRPMGTQTGGQRNPPIKPHQKPRQSACCGAPREQPNQSCAHARILERHPIKQEKKGFFTPAAAITQPAPGQRRRDEQQYRPQRHRGGAGRRRGREREWRAGRVRTSDGTKRTDRRSIARRR